MSAPTITVFKCTARASDLSGLEDFTEYFEAETREEAVEQWKAQAIAAGVDLADIELVSMVPVQTVKSLAPENSLFPGIHPDLALALFKADVTHDRIHLRYSDVQVMCATWQEAHIIRAAGPWRSMATVFKTNAGHSDAIKWPWGVDVAFGYLSGYIESKKRGVV